MKTYFKQLNKGISVFFSGKILYINFYHKFTIVLPRFWNTFKHTTGVYEEEELYRCSVCEKEFDTMPPDGMHSVHGRYPVKGGYIDCDGECGPVLRLE